MKTEDISIRIADDRRNRIVRDVSGLVAVAVLAAMGYFLFPNNLGLFTRILSTALFVVSLDLVVGFCGIATLGHAVLFGAGSYAAGIASARYGISDPIMMVAIGAAGGAAAAFIFGLVVLRAHGLAQLVLSIALVQLAHEAANKASAFTGGSDGLSGISPAPLFGVFTFDLWGVTAYWLGVALLLLVLLGLRIVTRSPFGMLCRGIKQDPVRVQAMGASVRRNLLKMYTVSGLVAGIAGALNAIATQVVGLDSVSFGLSAEALVMLVLGGVGTLYGAMIGAVSFMLFEDYVSAANPFHWLTIVGALLIFVVLVAPQGIYGSVADLYRRKRGQRE